MEKKKWVKLAGFAMVVLLSLFLCTGCSDTEQDRLVTVGFEPDQESLSRGLGVSLRDSSYRPEDLYWSYTAVKTSGIHTTGETTTEKPVSAGNVKGLSGFPKQFSTGNWTFSIYAYLNATDYAISNATTRTNARVFYCTNKAVNLTKSCSVAFQLTDGSKLDANGYLEIGQLTMRVPFDNRTFGKGKGAADPDSFILTITNDDAGNTVIARAETKLNDTYTPGKKMRVLFRPTIETGKNKWSGSDLKLHKFNVKVEYKYSSTSSTEIIREGTIQCSFEKGKTTVIDMNLDDLPLARQRVGGTIFFIKPLTTTTGSKLSTTAITGTADGGFTINNVHYIFFKEDGTLINLNGKTYQRTTNGYEVGTDTITPLLEDAYWCTVSKQSSFSGTYEDRIFVLDTTNYWVGSVVGNGSTYGGIGYGGHGTFVASTYGVPTNKDGIGQGKVTYQAVMNTKGTTKDAFAVLAKMSSSSSSNTTLWAYIDYLNNGTNYSGVCWAEGGRTYAVSAPGGCTDWYIPTPMELAQVGLWCGALKYFSVVDPVTYLPSGYTISSWGGKALPNVPYYGNGLSGDAGRPDGVKGRAYDHIRKSPTRMSYEISATDTPWIYLDTSGSGKQSFVNSSGGARSASNCSTVAIRSM